MTTNILLVSIDCVLWALSVLLAPVEMHLQQSVFCWERASKHFWGDAIVSDLSWTIYFILIILRYLILLYSSPVDPVCIMVNFSGRTLPWPSSLRGFKDAWLQLVMSIGLWRVPFRQNPPFHNFNKFYISYKSFFVQHDYFLETQSVIFFSFSRFLGENKIRTKKY